MRFPIASERFISSGSFPGVRLSSRALGVRYLFANKYARKLDPDTPRKPRQPRADIFVYSGVWPRVFMNRIRRSTALSSIAVCRPCSRGLITTFHVTISRWDTRLSSSGIDIDTQSWGVAPLLIVLLCALNWEFARLVGDCLESK